MGHSFRMPEPLRSGAVISALLALVFAWTTGAAAESDKEVTLKFSLKEGQVLEYKDTRRIEMNWHGTGFARVSTVKAELSLDKQLEEGLQKVALKFTERKDRMQRGGRDFEDFDGPVKPEGKTVRIEILENAKVNDAIGYIIGIKKGKPLQEYIERYFFRLPDVPVSEGSTWTRNIPEDEDGEDQEEAEEQDSGDPGTGFNEGVPEDAETPESHIEGTIDYRLEKFEKKDGIVVAVIKYEAEMEARQQIEGVLTESTIKSEGEAKIAVDGGYVVESKLSVEMKGDVIKIDDFTGKETRDGFVQVLHTELKLEK